MKPPEFLMVRPADVGRVGPLGACILAAVRYMTALSGEANGRRMVDGQMWWRASAPDIAHAMGGSVSPRTVSGTVRDLVKTGDLDAIPTQDFYGDRAKAYRAADQPSAGSDAGSELPPADTADRSADSAEVVGSIRRTTSADTADLPIPGELEELSEGKKARTARGTRLDRDWIPPQRVIDEMRVECPGIDLQAEHRMFIDYWTDKTGKDATKIDWIGTWRNWIRREAKSRGRPRQPASDLAAAQVQALKRDRGAAGLLEIAQ